MEIPLSAITAIEVRGVWCAFFSRGGAEISDTIYRYKCQLRAHHGASPTSPTRTDLVETEFVDEDPAAAMREASTVAAELAGALGVEHHVTDYPPLPPR